jgi:hypothetical protein
MRLTAAVITCLFLVTSIAFAQGGVKFVQPTKANVGIYENEVRKPYEKAMLTVGVDDRLQVIKTTRGHYQVKAPNGKKGWVEKRLVASTSGKQFLFDDAEVIGYLDNPTPVYIIDADAKDATPIKLDRSFAEALRENVDRETVERQTK